MVKKLTLVMISSRTGFSGGITYEHSLKKSLSFGAELIYNQRGSTIDNKDFGKSIKVSDYLSVPIKVGCKFGKKIDEIESFLRRDPIT